MKFGIQDSNKKWEPKKPVKKEAVKHSYKLPESPVKKVTPYYSESTRRWWLSIRIVDKDIKENE